MPEVKLEMKSASEHLHARGRLYKLPDRPGLPERDLGCEVTLSASRPAVLTLDPGAYDLRFGVYGGEGKYEIRLYRRGRLDPGSFESTPSESDQLDTEVAYTGLIFTFDVEAT